jgi:hypothetical protein
VSVRASKGGQELSENAVRTARLSSRRSRSAKLAPKPGDARSACLMRSKASRDVGPCPAVAYFPRKLQGITEEGRANMYGNPASKRTLLLFLAIISLVVMLLGCNLTTTPTPDHTQATIAALATVNAHLATQVARLATSDAHQATRIASQAALNSYLATRVGALGLGTRPVLTPVPTPPADLPPYTPTPPTVKSFPSPDGSRVAWVQDLGTLMIQEADGQQWELLASDEISSLAWFPDGRTIVYSDRDLSQPVTGRQDQLWIVNVETGQRHQIGTGYDPRVAPDGKHIAVLSGTLWGDACYVGYDAAILELDDRLQPVALYQQADFAGVPEEDESESIYPVDLFWQSSTQLVVTLTWACSGTESTYLLDLTTLEATRTDDGQD